ncbi:hypothetical protein FQR65_LT06605 [Abscondita terminalis]|nr:hypothetical protein FQR65_LT06605 [Abscondita terminalis]
MDAPGVNDYSPLNQEDIQNRRLAKQRDHNTATLSSLLLIETESFVKNKVKENIMRHTMQIHLQEAHETKNTLKSPISNLMEHKQKLEQQVQLESVYRSQTEIEMLNTEKIINMLMEHYGQLQSSYESENKYLTELKNKYNEQFENYQVQKEKILQQINEKKIKIRDMQDNNERNLLQSQTDINCKNKELTKLRESLNQFEEKIENAKRQVNVLNKDVEDNNKFLNGLKQEIHFVQNSCNNHSSLIKELEAKRKTDKENGDLSLGKLQEELSTSNDYLDTLRRKEVDLEESLIQESNKSKDLEESILKLEENRAELLLVTDELIKKRDNNVEIFVDQQCKLKNELNALKLNVSEAKQRLDEILLTKETKLKLGQQLEERNREDELKLLELGSLKKILLNENTIHAVDIERKRIRHDELKGKIVSLKSSLSNIQERHLQENEKYGKLNSDLDYKLLAAKNQLQNATDRYESTCKDLENKVGNYKYQLQVVNQQNEEDNKKILDELKTDVAKLKSEFDEKCNKINESKKLIQQKRELCEKYSKEFDELNKSEPHTGYKKPTFSNTTTKPTGILKSPGKTGVSPKKVKFDVESESQSTAEIDVWKSILLK